MFLMLESLVKHTIDIAKIANKLINENKEEIKETNDTLDDTEQTANKVMSMKHAIENMKNIKYDIQESIKQITNSTNYLFGNVNNQIFDKNPLEFLEIYVPAFTDMLKFASQKLIPTVKTIVNKTLSYSWLLLLKPIIFFMKDKVLSLIRGIINNVIGIVSPSTKVTRKEEAVAKSIHSTLENVNTALGMISAFAGGNKNKLMELLSKPIVVATVSAVGGKIFANFGEKSQTKATAKDKLLSFSIKVKNKINSYNTRFSTYFSKSIASTRASRIKERQIKTRTFSESKSFTDTLNKQVLLTPLNVAKKIFQNIKPTSKPVAKEEKVIDKSIRVTLTDSAISKFKSLKNKIKSIKSLKISDIGTRLVSSFKVPKDQSICDTFDSFAKGLIGLLLSPFKLLANVFGSKLKYFAFRLIRYLIIFSKKIRRKILSLARFMYAKYIRKPIRYLLFLFKKNIVRPFKRFIRRFSKWVLITARKVLKMFLKSFYIFVRRVGSTAIYQGISALAKQIARVVLKPVISLIVKGTSALLNFIPVPGLGTLLSIGLFALDLKYDISGKIVDGLFNLPETVSKMMDSLQEIFDKMINSLKQVFDMIISPFIDIFEFTKGLASVITGASYLITLKPILNIISKIGSVLGFDTFSQTVSNINNFLLDSLYYQPTYSDTMNFHEKVMYFPNIFLEPFRMMKRFIDDIFTASTGNDVFNDQVTMFGQPQTESQLQLPDSFQSTNLQSSPTTTGNQFTFAPSSSYKILPLSISDKATISKFGTTSSLLDFSKDNQPAIPTTVQTSNVAETTKQLINKDLTSKETDTEDNKTAQSTGRDTAFKTKPVSLKPIQDPIRIKNIVGYKLLFEQYF